VCYLTKGHKIEKSSLKFVPKIDKYVKEALASEDKGKKTPPKIVIVTKTRC
jgi:hypothetical protein